MPKNALAAGDVRKKCVSCGKCVEECPAGARKIAGVDMVYVDLKHKDIREDIIERTTFAALLSNINA